MRKTAEEIIDMVANHYDSEKRAYNSNRGFCEYRTNDGRKCAVGMCLNEEGINEFGRFEGSYVVIVEDEVGDDYCRESISSIDEYFEEEFRGQTNGFWTDLQRLHDDELNWDSDGLTEFGMQKVKVLKERHCNNK